MKENIVKENGIMKLPIIRVDQIIIYLALIKLSFIFYPAGDRSKPIFYTTTSNIYNNNISSTIPFSVEDEHTVGIGIDVDERRFFVFYKNNYAYYEYIMPDNAQK